MPGGPLVANMSQQRGATKCQHMLFTLWKRWDSPRGGSCEEDRGTWGTPPLHFLWKPVSLLGLEILHTVVCLPFLSSPLILKKDPISVLPCLHLSDICIKKTQSSFTFQRNASIEFEGDLMRFIYLTPHSGKMK